MATLGERGRRGEGGGSVEHELSRLREEVALLRAVAGVAADAVTILNLDGSLRRAFLTYARILGHEPTEVEGRHLLDFIHPQDQAEAVEAMGELQEPGAIVCRVIRMRHKEGHYLHMECTAHNRTDEPAVGGIIVHSRDVSARKALEKRLALAERMESVGRLASGVAHDFNNILAVIQLAASRATTAPADTARHLSQIKQAAQRASSLTKRLLGFARYRPQAPTRTNVGRLVLSMNDTLHALLPDTVDLQVEVPERGAYVMADPAELEQVLLNLVLNARDALPDGGYIRVSVELFPEPTRPEWVVLRVGDNGIGMDQETRESALLPFFTTKASGAGTGLGLWTVQEFASNSNGRFEVHSEPGLGTRCVLSLPAQKRGERRTVPPSTPPRPPRKATVLLAEDEPALRETIAELLRDSGLSVISARNGEEALAAAERAAEPIDALITDVLMPRLGGLELATRLRATRPSLRVLFVTGYGDAGEGGQELPGSRVLRKPFPAQELVDEVSRLLDS